MAQSISIQQSITIQVIWCLNSRNATIFRQALKWDFILLSLKNCTIQNVSHYSRTSGEVDRIPLISYDHLWSTLKLLLFCSDASHFPIFCIWKVMPIGVHIPQLVTSLQVTKECSVHLYRGPCTILRLYMFIQSWNETGKALGTWILWPLKCLWRIKPHAWVVQLLPSKISYWIWCLTFCKYWRKLSRIMFYLCFLGWRRKCLLTIQVSMFAQ